MIYQNKINCLAVTLYNCSVGRPDCSRCISAETSRPELLCGWCKDSWTCGVEGSPGCTRGVWIAASSNLGCPAPNIFQVRVDKTCLVYIYKYMFSKYFNPGISFKQISAFSIFGALTLLEKLRQLDKRNGSEMQCSQQMLVLKMLRI